MKTRNSAITLVELIIATILVGMVVAGVFSADYGLRRISENGAGDAQTAIQTKSLADAVRSAVKSLHISPADHGITILSAAFGSRGTICFRYDVGPTPDVYTDDRFTCFTQRTNNNVYRCDRASLGRCLTSDLLLGALVSDQFTNAIITAQGPMIVTTAGLNAFKMTFVGRKDPSAGAAITGGTLTSGTDANPQTLVKVFETAGF